MNPDGAADAPDQRFLDEVFERAVQLVEEGLVPETEALLAGHEALRAEVERLVHLARQVAVGATTPHPEVEGFTILQQLGQGGMGTVYLARQHSLGGRPVALKVLPNSAALSTRARARFLAEASAIARLRHPNIVAVHDVVHQDGVYAYAMEWVDGSSLAEAIGHQSPDRKGGVSAPIEGRSELASLAIPDICRIGIAIARALEAVHTAGLLHRDVKPSNILLRRDGTPLLADFGLARDVDSSVHTQAGQFAGTVAYAPPEQLKGQSEVVDARSDIYALGVTLYHALALRLPFEGRNPAAMLRRIEAGAATPLRKVNPRIPRDLETIVAKAMEADPARRYQTAGDLAADLERFMNYQPIQARPAGLLTRSVKLVRRNRGAALGLTVGSVITLALAAAAVTYVFFLPGWVAGYVREARLTLLDPGQANNIVSTMYWGRINPGGDAHWEARRQVLQQALIHYDRALRLASRDESIRREREVVSRAQQMTTEPRILNPANGPSGNHGPRRPMPTSVSSVAPLPGSLSASALRDDGLFAFLTHDYTTAIEKWSAWEQTRDPLLEPDPLVDAALGVLYLFDDQPGRAYPRLQKAAEAFPGVGFILEYLADAAVKCGDVERAERWLHEVQRLRTSAGGGAYNRIRASILARQGRDDEAEALFRAPSGIGPVTLEYARFLESRGRMDKALEQYSRAAAGMSGDRPVCEFVNAADRWWSALPQSARRQRIRSTCDDGGESLIPLLRQYQSLALRERDHSRTRSDAGRGRGEAGFQIFNLKYQVVAALCAWLSSPSLESLSLSELAERMEVLDMSFWNRLHESPTWIRSLAVKMWGHRMSPRMLALAALGVASIVTPQVAHAQMPEAIRVANNSSAGQYVRIADHPGLEPQVYTIECRITPRGQGFGNSNNLAGSGVIVKPREGASGNRPYSWTMQWSPVDGKLVAGVAFSIPNGGTELRSNTPVPVNTTGHVAMTFDGAALRIFINGVLDAETPISTSFVDYGSDDVLLGATNHCCGFDRRFDGEIDDVRIWNFAKSASEIMDQVNCEVTSNQAGLLAAWNFNNSSLQDVSGNGHNGTATGSISFVSNPMTNCTPCDAADVVQSPEAATVVFGGSEQLQVMAGGTGPLSYQWRKGGVNLTDGPVGCGGTISGATTDTLVLNTVTFVEGGSYDCVVTNACGSDTSTAATLTINPPPAAADVNHDGQVNGADIQALVSALLAP